MEQILSRVARTLVWLGTSGLVLALTACGGSDASDPRPAGSAGQLVADPSARRTIQAAATPNVDPVDAADQLLDFGQLQFPNFFPGAPASQLAGGLVYRFYPGTGVYLAVLDWEVYVFGGPFGPSIQHVGALTDFVVPRNRGAAACPAANLNWTQGERVCTAAVARTRSGHALTLAAAGGQAGSARFACREGAWSAPADIICLPPGRDAAGVSTADLRNTFSVAGTWEQVPSRPGETANGPFWGAVRIGAEGLEGIVLGGWYFASAQDTQVTPTRVAFLKQQPNGLMVEATSAVLGDALTNGLGSVIVHDFNGDGLDDILLPAHNEVPFVAAASTAYLSRSDGTFDKLRLTDKLMAHDAKLVTLDGKKRVLTMSFGGHDSTGAPFSGGNFIYTWNGRGFDVDTRMFLGGFSVLEADFTGDGREWILAGGWATGPVQTEPWRNVAFRYTGPSTTANQTPIRLPEPYFNNKPDYASFKSFGDPLSKTHSSRLWLTDFNQDGRPDVIVGQEIWSSDRGLQRSALQLLKNQGGMSFVDQTDELAPEYDMRVDRMDYTLRLVDIDASGIDSIFMVGAIWTESLDHHGGNQFLVNDGTGRFYAVTPDGYRGLTQQLIGFGVEKVRETRTGLVYVGPSTHPAMLPYRTKDGRVNYVAMLYGNFGYALFVNVPLGINVTTDFRRNLVIPSRNGSRNIRTFAGDDVIHRQVDDPDCRVDGGLGVNTVVYPGKRSNWIVARDGTKLTVRPAGLPGGTDTLVRIRYARFDDMTLDLNAED